MFTDPGKRQYLIFAGILALMVSGIISFFFSGILEGPFISGFPIAISTLEGIARFMAQLVNTVVLGAMLTVPMYYLLSWLNQKAGGGGF